MPPIEPAPNSAPSFTVGDGKVFTGVSPFGEDRGNAMATQADGKIVLAGYSTNGNYTDFALARYTVDGQLDLSFSGDGKLSTDFSGRDDSAHSVAVQADGRIVLAGFANDGNYSRIALARYLPDGSLDASFSDDGRLTTAIGNGYESASGVVLQPDGKILVAGSGTIGNSTDYAFALLRYNADGSLDSSFDGDGRVLTDFGSDFDGAASLVLLPDGRILVGGNASIGNINNFALARYNTDGSLDTSFDGDGKLSTAFGSGYAGAAGMVLQANGKLLVGGSFYNGSNFDFALARYNTDGSLDSSFSGDGRLTTAFGSADDHIRSLVVQADGSILVAGTSWVGNSEDFALARYNPDGSLDSSFSGDGMVSLNLRTAYAASDRAAGVIVQPGGRIVLAGTSDTGFYGDFALAGFNPDGTLDRNFGATYSLGGTVAYTEDWVAPVFLDTSIAIGDAQLDARNNGAGDYAGASVTLVRQGGASTADAFGFAAGNGFSVAGNALQTGSQSFATFEQSAGALTISFTSSGMVATTVVVRNVLQNITYKYVGGDPPPALTIDWIFNDGNTGSQGSGGALSVTGSTTVNLTAVNDANTRADFSTLPAGVIVTAVPGSGDQVSGVAIQADGRIVVAGNARVGRDNDFALVRYNADGSLDAGFGSGGRLTTTFGTSTDDRATALALQADGKILVAGQSRIDNSGTIVIAATGGSGTDWNIALARYNADGSLDTSFSGDGKLTTTFGSRNDYGNAIALQADGRIIVAGSSLSTNSDFALLRYLADGTLDPSFGSGGGVITDIGAGSIDGGNGVALQADGRILVAGSSSNGSDEDVALARYNTDGSLDTSFSTDGKLTAAIGGGDDIAYAIAVQADGRIVVAGETFNGSDVDVFVMRFNADGTPDTAFGNGGRATTGVGTGHDLARGVSLTADGRIVVAGSTWNGNQYDTMLLRYNGDGSLDPNFGTGGKVITPVSPAGDTGNAVAVQANGRIVVAGQAYANSQPYSNGDFSVIRYTGDGSLDTSFEARPTIDAAARYNPGGTPLRLETSLALNDADLDALNAGAGDYTGASVSLARQGGANIEDVFGFAASAAFAVVGHSLHSNGQAFASFSQSSGALSITFTSSGAIATQALVLDVLQHISYANTGANPPAALRIDWIFDDGNAGAQGTGGALSALASTPVTITPVNEAFVFSNLADGSTLAFSPTADQLIFDDPTLSAAQVRLNFANDGTAISLAAAGKTVYLPADIQVTSLNSNDLVFADGSRVVIGSAAIDELSGSAHDDLLIGLAGADILRGGQGNDTYVVDDAQDRVIELDRAAPILVSQTASGAHANGTSRDPVVSPSGRYAAFSSTATNLDPADTTDDWDLFIKDLQTGSVQRVFDTPAANSPGLWGFVAVTNAVFSADERTLAFYTTDANSGVFSQRFIYVKDLQTGDVQSVLGGVPASNVSFLGSGRYIVFDSMSPLVAGDTNNNYDIFVKDLQTGSVERISTSLAGTQGNDGSYGAVAAANGRYVTFSSFASNLVAGDDNATMDIFVKDVLTGQIRRASESATGQGANADAYDVSITADGRYVAFTSAAGNLVAGDTNGARDFFVKDLQTGAISLSSASAASGWAIAPDGRFGTYEINGALFVKNLSTGEIARLFDNLGQTISSLGRLWLPVSFSADSARIVFATIEPNLVPGTNSYESRVFATLNPFLSNGIDGGIDTVRSFTPYHTLGAHVENLELAGPDASEGRGNALPNLIIGNDAGNRLYGAGGNDTLRGGNGANSLYGEAGDDSLVGGAGSDWLYGGSGADLMIGGAGSDYYHVDDLDDRIIETPEGDHDTAEISVPYTLPDNVESLRISYGDGVGAIAGIGNALDNFMIGNGFANLLSGGAGNDGFGFSYGNDTLDGGSGIDTAYFAGNRTAYSITRNPQAGSFNVTGWNGSNTLFGVELLRFDNTTSVVASLASDAGIVDNFTPYRYLASNLDLLTFYGANSNAAVTHFLNWGFAEGRGASAFNAFRYLAGNPDLLAAFGANADAAAQHFVQTGRGEGRNSNFDAFRYLAANADLLAVFGANVDAAIDHFVRFGFAEGRGSGFDALRYLASNPDLLPFYGADASAAIEHYVRWGAAEGRLANFDGFSYLASNPDLLPVFGPNAAAAIDHFVHWGHNEGRQSNFDGLAYIAGNPDLIPFLGANAEAGAAHFVRWGAAEGRPVSFDGLAYVASYTDLMNSLGANANAGASHFIQTGFAQGRSTLFDAQAYLNGNPDLLPFYGSNTQAATAHYIAWGRFEGRPASFTGDGADNSLGGQTGNDSLAGRGGNDTLAGAAGNDTLCGGAGSDRLNGGSGADQFVFDTALNAATNVDGVDDFTAGTDRLVLDHLIFAQLGAGNLAAANFNASGAAQDADDFIVYNAATGQLAYDADANGTGAAITFASLAGLPAVTAGDFMVV